MGLHRFLGTAGEGGDVGEELRSCRIRRRPARAGLALARGHQQPLAAAYRVSLAERIFPAAELSEPEEGAAPPGAYTCC